MCLLCVCVCECNSVTQKEKKEDKSTHLWKIKNKRKKNFWLNEVLVLLAFSCLVLIVNHLLWPLEMSTLPATPFYFKLLAKTGLMLNSSFEPNENWEYFDHSKVHLLKVLVCFLFLLLPLQAPSAIRAPRKDLRAGSTVSLGRGEPHVDTKWVSRWVETSMIKKEN